MLGKMHLGRRFAHGLAALAVAGMTLSTPAQAQVARSHVAQGGYHGHPNRAAALAHAPRPRYHAQAGYGYRHHGYAYARPSYRAYPGYAYAPSYAYGHPGYGYGYPGYAYGYGYPGYGYPYYYRKKRNNGAAIAAAVIGGMALGAILSSQGRHPRKAYYKRRYR
jgi:hypothetical protein